MRTDIPINLTAAALIFAVGSAVFAAGGDTPDVTTLALDLRKTEQAFARTMAERDHEAFASFLAEEAVFFGRGGEIRGSAAVAEAWKAFFEGPEAPFSWQPDEVSVLGSGSLGYSSGPVYAPDGNRIGTFNSIWRRDADGHWKVVFDRGCPDCECPTSDEATD